LGAYIFLLSQGRYFPVTNYVYTLTTSCIIYFVAYKLVLSPELISPNFAIKYHTYGQFEGEEGEKYLSKLKVLMSERKLFRNADLKLSMLAGEVGLPPHQLSRLINEKFGKSFFDYINEHRVEEFLKIMNEATDNSYTLFGMALDAGFNSKSSFNTAFKKFTGKTPSQFKRTGKIAGK
jgi:AraC-like DNA-binding protein